DPSRLAEPPDTGAEPDVISGEIEAARLDKTADSDEFPGSEGQSDGAADSPQAAADRNLEADGTDDLSPEGTEEFALEDAVGVAQTDVSGVWGRPGVAPTLLSDDLPQEAIKTMQTMWSGALLGRTAPGMTIKGTSRTAGGGKSSLVIKERSLWSPGE